MTNYWSIVDSLNREPRARKTQNFKVPSFKPNFRGRLSMTSMGMLWPFVLMKHNKNLFIHDSS